eukprot:11634117-Prorocentrum_lima.AAC.1
MSGPRGTPTYPPGEGQASLREALGWPRDGDLLPRARDPGWVDRQGRLHDALRAEGCYRRCRSVAGIWK